MVLAAPTGRPKVARGGAKRNPWTTRDITFVAPTGRPVPGDAVPQSFASIHLHIVFSTKHREPLIAPEFAPRLYEYIGGTIRGAKCIPLATGGMPDHVHLLIGLGRETTVADLVRTAKAGSSRWVHDTPPDRPGFAWQSGYAAFTVSHDRLPAVQGYIAHQAEHHRTKTVQDEYREFLRAHGMEWDERYVWD
jgi:putative transposase